MKNHGEINIQSIINTFNHGFRILSHVQHLGSASRFKVSVASILGVVAGIILVLRDGKAGSFRTLPWSSDNKISFSEEFWVVPGLRNLGNNCFLNVILQALASCSRGFLRKRLEDFEALEFEELVESMPLAVSLDSLLEELYTPRQGREVLSPREVMIAIDHYNHNFNLTNQQDAEEALFHILSSLREELAELYVSNLGSLADVTALANCRILSLERRVAQIDHQRWQQTILGPFDGILGSILTCHSCSSQISLDFQYFHSLHLPLMAGSSVEGCLKHFFAAEKLENYYCSNCWHIAAIKCLCATNENEADAVKLRNCSKQDSCDCRNLSHLGALPWSNNFSRTFKQLNIARCPKGLLERTRCPRYTMINTRILKFDSEITRSNQPQDVLRSLGAKLLGKGINAKILCLHLQCASVNVFGELIKFQGHISFPLTLNMNRFMNSGVGINSCKENLPMWQSKKNCRHPFPFSNHLDMQPDTRRLNYIYGQMENNVFSEAVAPEEFRRATSDVLENTNVQVSQGQQSLSKTGGCSEINSDNNNTLMQSDDKISLVVSDDSKQVTSDVLGNTNIEDSQWQPSMSEIGGYSDTTANNKLLQSNSKIDETRDSVLVNLHVYGLVSVVQHFGQGGSGHYTIYRRASAMLKDGDPNEITESTSVQWFGISDSEVYDHVLASEASVLFYEKISDELF